MAPEVLRHEPYDQKCDVYSFAILCWEMLTFRLPFEQKQPVQAAFAMALEGQRPSIPAHCPPDVERLLERSWSEASEARPSFAQVCDELRTLQKALRKHSPVSADAASRCEPDSSAYQDDDTIYDGSDFESYYEAAGISQKNIEAFGPTATGLRTD